MHELDARGAPGFEAIATASLSDAGRVRAENQDATALLQNTSQERLLLVADGMGGHRGGETASKICLATVERVFREPHGTPEQRLIRSLELANEEIYSHALANPVLRGMGTTAVVALLAPGGAWVAWVGDSRLYRLRAGLLEQLTQDHSLMTEWIGIGVITAEAAKTHPRRHELTRALGQSPDVVVDLLPVELRPGDRLLLCSDGLHGCVPESVLTRALKVGVPDVVACALVDAANANGGPDNVSVVVATLPDAPEPEAAPKPEAAAEPAPEIPACAPEIAAELGMLDANETLSGPEPDFEPQFTAEAVPAAEPVAEESFADLGAELGSEVGEAPIAESPAIADASEPEAEPTQSQEIEPPPVAAPIQIPLMTPVRVRRGLDVASLAIGIAITLVVVGLGFGVITYTESRSTRDETAAPRTTPSVVRARPSAPAAQPAPPAAAKPAAVPVARAEIVREPSPVVAKLPDPAPAAPAPPAPARTVAPAPQARALPTPPSVPAAPAQAAAQPAAAVSRFELTPPVERFLTAWLGALATDDRARLRALGFPDEPTALAGTPGSRDGFRLVAADIDEARSREGRVYLRLIVSYAFTDANGRFRTQDEQRLILDDVAGRLRFAGRWQQ